ncbi:MAG TPA: alkaline phosphatase family protein [Thermoplasmata archaeon]|nr:alkaline phosphatase family protein [Thermoplasmata archaeon]
MRTPHRRFLVLGLDGGTFDLLDPLMEAGELPFLRSLVHRGVRAPLRSVYPAKTIPAWYSFATGKDPGELGIFGFTEPDGRPERSRLVQTFRPAEAVWDRLSRFGVKVGVLNFPMRTAYPLHGFVVPGMFSSDPPTYPRSVRSEIESAIGAGYPEELPAYRESHRAEWVSAAARAVLQRGHAAAALAERHRPDFLFALFRETDRIEHEFWDELDRPVASISPDLLAFWRSVDRACKEVDTAFRSDGGPAITLVISDHGHGGIRSEFLTNRWLAEEKFLVFRENSTLARRRLVSRVMLYAQRIGLARRLTRRVAGFVRDGRRASLAQYLSGRTSFEDVTGQIDWKRTIAFSYPVPEGIYLNPHNPDLTSARRAEILQKIRERLEAFPEAHIEVFGPGDIYRGRRLDLGPALFIRVDGMGTEPRMDFSYPQSLIRDRPNYFYGTGNHRMEGIFIGAGDGVEGGRTLPALSLLDVTPTILNGMGAPGASEMVGHSFFSDLTPIA